MVRSNNHALPLNQNAQTPPTTCGGVCLVRSPAEAITPARCPVVLGFVLTCTNALDVSRKRSYADISSSFRPAANRGLTSPRPTSECRTELRSALLRQQRTRTRRAFDRPHARFEARRPVEESLSLETVRCHRQLVLDLFVIVEHDRDMRAAVRTDSDDEHQFLPFLSS